MSDLLLICVTTEASYCKFGTQFGFGDSLPINNFTTEIGGAD